MPNGKENVEMNAYSSEFLAYCASDIPKDLLAWLRRIIFGD